MLSKGNVSTGVGNIYAIRGIPGADGQAAQWSTAVRLDTDAIPFKMPYLLGQSNNLAVAVSRNGNAHAVWGNVAACGSGYTLQWPRGCYYIYSSFYDVSSNKWSAPLLVSDTTDSTSYNGSLWVRPTPYVNDRGDVAVKYQWRDPATVVSAFSQDTITAVAWRAVGQAGFQKRAFIEAVYGNRSKTVLDNAGGMIFAGEKAQLNNSNKDVYTYMGNVASGFATTTETIVDTLNSDARLQDLAVGPTGDALLRWVQNDGSGNKIFGASKTSATSAWSAPVAISANTYGGGTGFVNDSGDAGLYVGCTAYIRPKATGIWAAMTPALPKVCNGPGATLAANAALTGDSSFLTYPDSDGLWESYNQPSNTMARTANAPLTSADYLLGFSKGLGTYDGRKVMYTKKADGNYVGAFLVIDAYDTLPTPTATSGIGRPGIDNLWGFYLK